MKYIISNYNNDLSWVPKYTDDYIIYNQGEPLNDSKVVQVSHRGSDICDKFSWIIDNYNSLPEVVCLCKGNLFKFITPQEFEKVKDNKVFTPLLTQHHKVYYPICGYDQNGIYCERNDFWYLQGQPLKYAKEIIEYFKMSERTYNVFAPGSNYILPCESILRTHLEDYKLLRSWIDYDIYPAECQLMERNLYYLWR